MKNKIIAILLALVLVFSLAACGNDNNKTNDGNSNGSSDNSSDSNSDSNTDALPGIDSKTEANVGVTKSGDEVVITLPQIFISNANTENFDAEQYAKENGFTSANINSDGSVSITMTSAKHEEIMSGLAAQIKTSCDDIVSGDDAAYIKAINYNDTFTDFEIRVDKEGYESAVDTSSLQIYTLAYMYSIFNGDDGTNISVRIVDDATDEIISNYNEQSIEG